MTAPACFADRWRAAVTNLRLGTERVQATADAIPLDADCGNSCDHLLGRHKRAVYDHMTALACVEALLREHDAGTR